MSDRNNYSLRSRCRKHGSCNCQNSPDLPKSARRSSTRKKKSTPTNPITVSPLNLSDLTSDLSDSEFDTSATSTTSSFRYGSSNSSKSSSKRSVHVVSSLSSSVSNVSRVSVQSLEEDSDYSSNNSACDSVNVSLSGSFSSQKETELRGILVNSEGGEKSRSVWFPRNVTFGFATSTPLSSIQNKELHDFEDLREEDSFEIEDYPVENSLSDKMHPSSTARTRGKILNQNYSKFATLEEGGRRGAAYSSLNRRSETSLQQNGVSQSEEHVISTKYTSTSTRSRSRAGTPSSVDSRISGTEGVESQRPRRRHPIVPIIDEGTEDLFMTPRGDGGGGSGRRNGNNGFANPTGDYNEGEDINENAFQSYFSSWGEQIKGVFAAVVRIVLSGPLFIWAQVMRFIGLPLYWLLVQCLVSEKWVLDREQGRNGGGVRSVRSGSWYGLGWISRMLSLSSSSSSRVRRGKSLFGDETVFHTEEYFSDDEGSGGLEMNKKNANLNGGGKFTGLNGHGYEQTIPTPTTGRGQDGGMSLYQRTISKWFGSSTSASSSVYLNNQNQTSTQFGDMNIVGVSKLGKIAGWGKNLLVCWKSNDNVVTGSRGQSQGRYISNSLSDDESEVEYTVGALTSSRTLEAYGFVGRVCRFLAKLALLLLALMLLAYLAYFLWPFLSWGLSETWGASKGHIFTIVDGASSLFTSSLQLGTVFLTTLTNFFVSFKPSDIPQQKTTVVIPAADPPHCVSPPTPVVVPLPPPELPPAPPAPPAISKEEFDALLERINTLEAQLKLNSGKISQVDGSHKREINEMRAVVEAHREEMDGIKTSLSSDMGDEIEKQVKIACKINCQDPIVQPIVVPPPAPTPPPTVEVQALIDRAIQKYDADKTGRPDLALESSGGSIINTRCTKSSKLRQSVVSLWGWKIWSPPNNPRTIIQPGVVPGECWAFEGSVGDVVIQLVSPAVLTGFTMEHISKWVSPYGNIDSAPYQFQVLGLTGANDLDTAHDYGTYSYEDNGQALQYFDVLNHTETPYPIVELKILSNHGNLRYTCLYRFRVHGHLSDFLSTPFTMTVQDHE